MHAGELGRNGKSTRERKPVREREEWRQVSLDDVPVRSCGGTAGAAKARAVGGEAVRVVGVGKRRGAGKRRLDEFEGAECSSNRR